jgi:hypothetical protein
VRLGGEGAVCWYLGGHHLNHMLISHVVGTIRAITNRIQRAIRLRCDEYKIDTTGGVMSHTGGDPLRGLYTR